MEHSPVENEGFFFLLQVLRVSVVNIFSGQSS